MNKEKGKCGKNCTTCKLLEEFERRIKNLELSQKQAPASNDSYWTIPYWYGEEEV